MKNLIILATDGSSLIKGDKYEASSACVIYINGTHVCDVGVYHNNGTNSLGEVYAIVLGLDRVKEIINENDDLEDSQIIVLSDSDYVVKSLNTYIYSWSKQGMYKTWKSSKGDDVAYQSLFKYLWKTYHSYSGYWIGSCPVKICHMRGHIGEKVTKQVAYQKFVNKNSLSLKFENFEKLISYNHHVDKLANHIRVNKLIYHEEVGDNKWVKNPKKINTRNGRIVIIPRSKKRN